MEQIHSATESVIHPAEEVTPGLESFVPEFFEDRKKDLTQLKADIVARNFDSARKIAHNWKGYCEPYGFAHLGLMAAELEKSLVDGDAHSVDQLLTSIEVYFANKKLPTTASN